MPDDPRMKPDFSIQLDGTKLKPEEAAAILGIRVFQTRAGASAFEIVVSDPDLSWQGKPTFTDCKEVQIELGVPGKLKKVFDGEVTAWRTELERSGPTVLVLRGMDRSHRMMRAKKTKTYANASPLDCARQIAGQYGLTAKTRAGSPAPVKMFRFQANQTDFDFLSSMAELEGYMFWVEGSELHFERPQLSNSSDAEFTLGEEIKAFLPVANFRKPPASVEVGAWDASGKAEITGKAKTGDELWSVPGGQPGAKLAKFSSTKPQWSVVESQVATQEHADTVAKAALTRRSMEFITAEVEVRGNPRLKPGSMVNLKKVGAYSGNYLVTEANHFFDSAGYSCIFYVARDKWGDSSTDKEKAKSAKDGGKAQLEETPYKAPKPKDAKPKNEPIDFTLHDDQGKALSNVKVKISLASGEVIDATTGDGHVHVDDKPPGPYTIELADGAVGLTTIDLLVQDAAGNPVSGASGKVTLSDGAELVVMTDSNGEVHLTDVPPGQYTFKLDDEGSGWDAPPPPAAAEDEEEEEEKADSGADTASVQAGFEAAHFDTDKALPLPAAIPVFRAIAAFLQQNPDRVLLVVGHTDSVGGTAHNLELSEDRATAVAAYLRDDVDAWMQFYDHPTRSARWGTREDQLMLSALPYGEAPYYDGAIDGIAGPMTRAAFKELQEKHELEPTGEADDATRRALVLEYMQAEDTSAPAADIRTLGCGEQHRVEQTSGPSQANRRVDVFAFESGEIVPKPDECVYGKHPGCDVYDRWKNKVTGQLGATGEPPKAPEAEDLIPKARLLHKAYLDARDELVKWSVEPERAGRRFVGEWCEGLAKDEKFKDRIDLGKLQQGKQQDQDEMRQKQEEVERRAKELLDFLDDPRLKKQLRKSGAAGMREAASLVQGVGESLSGGAWIARQVEAVEGGEGLLSWVLSKEAAEQAVTTTEGIHKGESALDAVLEALAEAAGTLVRLKQDKAVEYIAEIVAVRFKLRVANLVTHEWIEIHGGMVSAVLYRREITVLRAEKLLDHHTIETFGKALGTFAKLVAAVNLLAKLDLLVHDPSLKNVISTVGGLAELLDTFETARSMANKFVRYGREVAEDGAPKAVEFVAETGEVAAATGGRRFLTFLGESVGKKLTPLAVVAGAADAVTGSMEAYEEADKGNISGAVAHSGVALGGALMAIAGTMELTGLGADATVFGAPAGIVLGILGLIVGVAGAIASIFTSESELELWAEHCRYGRRYGRDKYAGWKDNLERQIDALTEALYQVRVKGDLKQDVSHVEIEPTGLTKASKMTCFVNVSSDLTMMTARQDLPLRDDQKDCEIEFGDGERANFVKTIKLRVDMPRQQGVIWSKMMLVFSVDPEGDGVAPFKRTAELTQGVLEWIWSKL